MEFLALLILELPVVHEAAHRWGDIGRNLYQIKTIFLCDFQGLGQGEDTHLFPLGIYYPYLFAGDLFINP